MGDSVITYGSLEEGGGQILRPALTLSAITGRQLTIAEYEHVSAGFNAFGARGKSLEAVAGDAAGALLSHLRSGAALDLHLADQALLPLALACGPSTFTCEGVTRHLETNAWVIGQFAIADVLIEARHGGLALVSVRPQAAAASAQGRPV